MLPSPSDITYEGIFNEYYFDTQDDSSGACEDLFCPKYSVGISYDPLYGMNQSEYYIAVGLDSGLKVAEFKRKTLNLVIMLDVSGSMGAAFDKNLYDGPFKEDDLWAQSKMSIAKMAVKDMLSHLEAEDRLGIVTFESSASVVQELTLVKELDFEDLNRKIDQIQDVGQTNMEAGYQMSSNVLNQCFECRNSGLEQYENRIVILTDAQPNAGDASQTGLSNLVSQNAQEGVFTSVIGIGLDFNSTLVEFLTKTRGANYYNVYSPQQFRDKLDAEFDFMVTPLVFDLKLEIDPSSFNNGLGWQVIKVYGSPNLDGGLNVEGTIIEINTLFPAPKTEDGAIKGGVVLLKVFKPSGKVPPFKLKTSYKDRNTLEITETFQEVVTFTETNRGDEYYGSSGVRKAILLSRYVDLLRGWMIDQHKESGVPTQQVRVPSKFCVFYPEARIDFFPNNDCYVFIWCLPDGVILPIYDAVVVQYQVRWEGNRQSLRVNKEQGDAFRAFLEYMTQTKSILQDNDLQQEIEILQTLIGISQSR
eukprot:TRINITY_DN67446_c0_g1_i2.p1 TRINITY_DN67446_c0_g1~~TRINITY_DN67446_c0_g1_i2.p1  ORF type:complete len:531 (-),score=56.90 TRINITY_DN67446_c0_g1_i2:586-2178(-)